MKNESQLWRQVANAVGEGGQAVLCTCGSDGMPHATWMTALVPAGVKEVVGITSPNTHKVDNIRANSKAEWMFSSRAFETVVHLSGPTEIIEDEEEALRYWHMVPRKSQGYYRNYCNPDDFRDFAVIRTRVRNVVHSRPLAYRKTSVGAEGVELPA